MPSSSEAELFYVRAGLAAKAFGRLGLNIKTMRADRDGLAVLYLAWCRTVPFDNLRKRLFLAGGAVGEVPGDTATAFLDDFVTGGTGGTCWSTSLGFVALARTVGFEASLVPATMLTDPGLRPNHASVIVALPEGDYLVDTSMLYEHPVPLRPGQVFRRDDPLHPIVATPSAQGSWLIEWVAGHSREQPIGCQVTPEPVAESQIRAWHDRTRAASLFNAALFIRRNEAGGVISYGRGKLITVGRDGERQVEPVPPESRSGLLAGRFGVSPSVIELLPSDDPQGEAFV